MLPSVSPRVLLPTFASLALCGCDAWPLGNVIGADAAAPRNAFSEHEFAADAAMAAQLDHIVHIHLEPEGAHDGDTGEEEGVDEVTYELLRPTTLSLGVPLAESHGHWLELCDSAGEPLTFARGRHVGSAVRLPPGRYKVRVHHKGVAGAEAATMFLRTTTHELPDERSQRQQWTPGAGGDAFSLACTAGSIKDQTSATGITIWLTGDLSCATVVGLNWDQTVPPPTTLRFQNQTHDARFERCNFTNGRIIGGGTNIQFQQCGLGGVTWENCALAGASMLNRCTLTGGKSSGAKLDLTNATIDNCPIDTTFLAGCILANTSIRWSGLAAIEFGTVDLATATLEYCNFNNARLHAANLTTTTIRNCFFNAANFDGADLSGNAAMLLPAAGNTFAGAAFAGAKLRNIDLTPLVLESFTTDWSRVDFSGSNLSGKTLTALKLDGAIFGGANLDRVTCRENATAFVGADLRGAKMGNADFSNCNFSRAILDRASAAATKFPDCNFDECTAHGASFEFCDLSRASFVAAQLGSAEGSGIPVASFASAYMPDAKLTNGADCRSVSFAGAHLYGQHASVASAELTLARFDSAIISGLDFTAATLTSSSFVGAQAVSTRFINANLDRASFNGAYIMGANFSGASTGSTDFTNAAVSTGPCSSAADCSRCPDATCSFLSLDPSRLCCFSYSERDGSVLAVNFAATTLPTSSAILCPNGDLGPCDTAEKLRPRDPPFPAVPACVPSLTRFCPPPTR